jgi:hypothetical protein
MVPEIIGAAEPIPERGEQSSASRILLLVAFCAAIAVSPMLLLGYHPGHDRDTHVASWMEATQQFRQMILFPRWAAEANYGFGEPRFIFYPPFSWMLGGVLGLFIRWTLVPAAYVWLALIIAGATMWKCSREWLPPPQAAIAAVLYAVNPYALVMAYNRCAYGELLASAFFPLLVWAGLRASAGGGPAVMRLAAVLAAIWLTNFPAGVIATYSLVVLLFIQWLFLRSWRTAWFGVASILLGLGLDAFVLLPAAWEKRWVDINAVLIRDYLPWHNFLFATDNIGQMVAFNRKISLLALFLACSTFTAILLARKLRETHFAVWLSVSVLGILSFFMMFPWSLPLWQYLPELRFVQFPWRWLFPLVLAGSLLTAAVATQLRQNWPIWVAIVLALLVIDSNIIRTEVWTTQTIADLDAAMRSGQGYEGLPEYAPISSQPLKLWKEAPSVVVIGRRQDVQWKVQVDEWSIAKKVISVDSTEPLDLDLKLLAYPSWRATINDRDIDIGTNPGTGQIRLRVPAGFNRIEVLWRLTWDMIIGKVISLLAILTIVFLSISRPACRVRSEGPVSQ